MTRPIAAIATIAISTLAFTSLLPDEDAVADKEAVVAAVGDYVDAIYNVQPERIDRSVDVTLRKYGYWRPADSDDYRSGSEMNFKQLRALAARWNADGHLDVQTARREISVLDMYDKTASAKLVADWGIDYFHLSKDDDQWKIVNIIWQAHPPAM